MSRPSTSPTVNALAAKIGVSGGRTEYLLYNCLSLTSKHPDALPALRVVTTLIDLGFEAKAAGAHYWKGTWISPQRWVSHDGPLMVIAHVG